jgi:hypothetical protein
MKWNYRFSLVSQVEPWNVVAINRFVILKLFRKCNTTTHRWYLINIIFGEPN